MTKKQHEPLMDFVNKVHKNAGYEHAKKGEKPHPDGMIEKQYNSGYKKAIKEHEAEHWGD